MVSVVFFFFFFFFGGGGGGGGGFVGGFFFFFFFFFFNFLFGCLFCYVSFPWVQTKVKEFKVNCDG